MKVKHTHLLQGIAPNKRFHLNFSTTLLGISLLSQSKLSCAQHPTTTLTRLGWTIFVSHHCFGGRSLLFMHASTEYRVHLPLHCMCTFEPMFQLYEHAQTRCFQCSVLLLHRTYPTWNQLRNMTCHRPQKLTFLSTPWSACQCSFLKVSFTRSTSKASIPCKTFGTQFLHLSRTASHSSCHILRSV